MFGRESFHYVPPSKETFYPPFYLLAIFIDYWSCFQREQLLGWMFSLLLLFFRTVCRFSWTCYLVIMCCASPLTLLFPILPLISLSYLSIALDPYFVHTVYTLLPSFPNHTTNTSAISSGPEMTLLCVNCHISSFHLCLSLCLSVYIISFSCLYVTNISNF